MRGSVRPLAKNGGMLREACRVASRDNKLCFAERQTLLREPTMFASRGNRLCFARQQGFAREATMFASRGDKLCFAWHWDLRPFPSLRASFAFRSGISRH